MVGRFTPPPSKNDFLCSGCRGNMQILPLCNQRKTRREYTEKSAGLFHLPIFASSPFVLKYYLGIQ
jgi:hypothetical protein